MLVKDLAKTFKMNVSTMANIAGYSRQFLNIVISKEEKCKSPRYSAFVQHLEIISENMYMQDKAQARIEKNERDKAIKELKKKMNA